MSKNDFCRCCKKNLRIHGELTNTISIFERNSKGECTYEQVLRLGLHLHNTSNKSYRICRSYKSHVCWKRIQPKRSLVTWLITLLLIICPSSYRARPDNLIGPNSFCSGIVSPQRSNARPNFPTSNVVGGACLASWLPWTGLNCLNYLSSTQ